MHLALVAAALLLAGCTRVLPADEPRPAFPTFPREQAGSEGRIYLVALGYGRLARRGRCLGMTGRGPGFITIVWPYSARLGRDRLGLFVTDSESGNTLRLGDWMAFGSGPTDGDTAYGVALSEPVPAECRARIAALSPGIKKHRRPGSLSASWRPRPARSPARRGRCPPGPPPC